MSQAIEQEIRTLRAHFWSSRDPEGRAFAPLADAYRRKGDLSEATSLVEDGLARLPDFTPGHLIAARISRAQGDLEGARSALDRVLELDGHNVLALLERAELARDTGDAEGAAGDLRQLLELEPGHMGARAALERLEASEGGLSPAEARAEPRPSHDEPEADLDPFESDPDPFEADLDPAMEGPESPGVTGDFEVDDLAWESTDLEGEDVEPGLQDAEVDLDDLELESTSLDPEAAQLDPAPEPDDELAEPGEAEGDRMDVFDFELDEGEAAMETPEPTPEGELRLDETEADVVEAGDLGGEDDTREGTGAEDDVDDGMVTRTMGEILARQGLVGEAVRVYEQLADRNPEDAEIRDRLMQLRQSLAGDPSASTATSDPADLPAVEDEPELRDVAPQWADEEDAEAGDEVATPFAWGEDEPEEETTPDPGAADDRERSIADYFDDLLAWSPGAVPVEHLAPDAPADTAPPESLAALGTPGERSPVQDEPAEAGDQAATGSEDDLDDFRDWLKSLET